MVRVKVPGNRTQEQFNQLNYSSDRKGHIDISKTGTDQPPRGQFGYFAFHDEKEWKMSKSTLVQTDKTVQILDVIRVAKQTRCFASITR